MTLVSGDLKLVTNEPATISEVWIRAERPRLHGTSYVVDDSVRIQVLDGSVEFEAIPGPAVMTLISGGQPTGQTVKLIIPDAETATLADASRPGITYTPDIVSRALQAIIDALEDALAQVDGAVDDAISDRVPPGLGLSQDNSVGTRIFAGDTMIHGDTGLRELFSAASHELITSGRILIRRISGTVFLYVNEVQFTTPTPGFGALPRGFRGESVSKPGETLSGTWPSPDGTFTVSTFGYLNFYRVPTDKTVSAFLTYSTGEAWPTTLPGTPA